MTLKRIALSAGHRNANRGGHPCELADLRTGRVVQALAAALRGRGSYDVRVVQPQEGLGMFPGGLQQAAAQVVAWHNAGWKPELYLEIHFEGNGSQDDGRGCFVIYPDKGGELDTDARDRLAPAICDGITRRTGVPRRGDGRMPESKTAVGLERGARLGVFAALSPIRATLTRALVEVAACSAPSDWALIQGPHFIEQAAAGIADGIDSFFGSAPQATAPIEIRVPEPSGIAVDPRVLAAYERSGGVWQAGRLTPGLPLTPLFDGPDGHGYQLFERSGVRVTVHGSIEWLLTDEAVRLRDYYESRSA